MAVETISPRPAPPARASRRGPGERLRSAVLALCGSSARLVSHSERAWASITFAGTRHMMMLEFAGPEAIAQGETFIAELPEHEFAIVGQLVADAAIRQVDHAMLPQPCLTVECELLLLEEA